MPNTRKVYDLHTHTTYSDGILTPEQLLQRAVIMGVDILAITDHDTVSGLAEARQKLSEQHLAIKLINGVEISTVWQGFDIHIVGLNFDVTHPEITACLQEQQHRRWVRAQEIASLLEKRGIPEPLAGVQRIANGANITRSHFARYLVEINWAASTEKVFRHYLTKGKPGYVSPNWCDIAQAVAVIQAAGGQAILAHPDSYALSAKWLRKLIAYFAEVNGDGLEVARSGQSTDKRIQLARYAKQYQLVASLGSDFHAPYPWVELGRGLTLPDEDILPVWHNWS